MRKPCRLWACCSLWWTLVSTAGVSLLLLLVEVALIIEVTEEDDEGDAVTEHHQVHEVGEVALREQVVTRVQEEQQELHLERQQDEFRPHL